MKRSIFILLSLPIVFTACTTAEKSSLLTEEDREADSFSSYNSEEVLERINDINNGATPKIQPEKKAGNTDKAGNNNNENTSMGKQEIKLENLANEYSQALMKTSLGDIKMKFYAEESPLTVNNFMNLAKSGFYDGTRFHRVINDFMIQGGDPLSKDPAVKNRWGTGGPEYRFNDEINSRKLVRGSLAMANSGPNTNGSQFFIVTKESTPWLDGKHTNFGEVTEGMAVVRKIETLETDENDRPLEDVIVEKVELLP